jgi:hypothetical protein
VKINPWAITDKGENWLRWEDGQLKRKAKLMHADTTTTCRNILFLLFTQPLNPLTDAARTTSELLRAVDYSASSKEGRRLLTALAKDGLVYQPVPGYWLLTEAGIKQHEQLSVIDRLKTIKEPVVAEDGLQKARRLVDQQYKKPPVSDLDRVVRLERKTAAQRKTLKYYTTRIESLSTALKKCEAEHKEFLNALDMLRAHLAHLGALGALK